MVLHSSRTFLVSKFYCDTQDTGLDFFFLELLTAWGVFMSVKCFVDHWSVFVSSKVYFLYSNLQSPWKNSFLFENTWTTGTASNRTTWRKQWLMFHSRWGLWRLACDILVRTRHSEFIMGYFLISLGSNVGPSWTSTFGLGGGGGDLLARKKMQWMPERASVEIGIRTHSICIATRNVYNSHLMYILKACILNDLYQQSHSSKSRKSKTFWKKKFYK